MEAPPTAEELLKTLIRFNTVRPGQEADCIAYICDLLTTAGISTNVLAHDPARPNLIARLSGTGLKPPLLLYGHIDVVPTTDQKWDFPPFEAQVKDGFLWGRGALDMKSGIAMMLSAVLRIQAEGSQPPGDVILVIVSDEESGSLSGAKYLVENCDEHFEGVQFAISEFGGFSQYIQGRRFYPIQVAEKSFSALKATIHGQAGHGAFTSKRGSTMDQAADLIHALNRAQLPIHMTPPAYQFINTLASALPFTLRFVLRQILNPRLAGLSLRAISLLEKRGTFLDSLVRNTVNPTLINGGSVINVMPSEVSLGLDCRLLPGFTPDDLIAELTAAIHPGENVTFEVAYFEPYALETPNMGLFDTLASILREGDPAGIPAPFLLPASSDARFFSRLGIQTYGYIPMFLPPGFEFAKLIHNANERIPLDAVRFGAGALYKLLHRF